VLRVAYSGRFTNSQDMTSGRLGVIVSVTRTSGSCPFTIIGTSGCPSFGLDFHSSRVAYVDHRLDSANLICCRKHVKICYSGLHPLSFAVMLRHTIQRLLLDNHSCTCRKGISAPLRAIIKIAMKMVCCVNPHDISDGHCIEWSLQDLWREPHIMSIFHA
jgi:hypothetical protein